MAKDRGTSVRGISPQGDHVAGRGPLDDSEDVPRHGVAAYWCVLCFDDVEQPLIDAGEQRLLRGLLRR
jgi:hypothetical protein